MKKYYLKELIKLASYKNKQYKLALEESFLKIDDLMQTTAGKKELAKMSLNPKEENSAGSTATTVLITPNEIYCANIGDSRTVVCRNGTAFDLSQDHKGDMPEERKRIINAGGTVESGRVNGVIAMSRAFGDFEYKNNSKLGPKDQMVTAFPEVRVIPHSNDIQFIPPV